MDQIKSLEQTLTSQPNIENKINPLQNYFREPGLSITLPSKSIFYKNNEVELTINGELPVYPMTAQDEIILKNPDALLNGDAIEKLINSCCPSVKDVRSLVGPDVDAILLAIRSASYGQDMEVEVECPNCKFMNTFLIDIELALNKMSFLQEENEVTFDDNLIVYLKPYNYKHTIKAALMAYEETKILNNMSKNDVSDDERALLFSKSYSKLSNLNLELLKNCIYKISIPGSIIEDKKFISDYINNIGRDKIKKLNDEIESINNTGANRELDATCTECDHKWKTEITFDPAHFFE